MKLLKYFSKLTVLKFTLVLYFSLFGSILLFAADGKESAKSLKGIHPVNLVYGGNLTEAYNIHSVPSRTINLVNLRLFANLTYLSVHHFDFRYKASYTSKFNPPENYSETEDYFVYTDENGNTTKISKNDLELSYIEKVNFNGTYKKFSYVLGRSYFRLGNGLTFSGIIDGVNFAYKIKNYKVQLFSYYTGMLPEDDNPYDLLPEQIAKSAKVKNAGERVFYGFAFSSPYIIQSKFGLSFLGSKDLTTDPSDKEAQKYKYDTNYTSLFAKGQFLIPNFVYRAEYVMQTGSSYLYKSSSAMTDKQTDISANGLVAEFIYLFRHTKGKPSLSLLLARGSGDEDRRDALSPSANTLRKDESFNSFGLFSAGFVLNPSLANLTVLSPGVKFNPLNLFEATAKQKFSLEFKYYKYRKSVTDAPISDSKAELNKRDIGQAFDVMINYVILSDLAFFYVFGVYLPGDAYASVNKDTQTANYFSLALRF